MRVLYLGLSGTTHPSATTYHLVRGKNPWDDGHAEYEAVPWLAQALACWPDPGSMACPQSCSACRRWPGGSSATPSRT
jgi:hypothetical protein